MSKTDKSFLETFVATKYIERVEMEPANVGKHKVDNYIRVFGFPNRRPRIKQEAVTSYFTTRNEAAEWLLNAVLKVSFSDRQNGMILEIDGKKIAVSSLLLSQEKTP